MLSNKNKLNIVIVILFLIILAIIVTKNRQENFVDVQLLDIKSGLKGDMGPSGVQGPPGPAGISGTSYVINENNMYIKDSLKLGTNNLVYISPDKNNHYSQLKLSKKINANGIKLKIPSSELNDYIRAETDGHTDFVLNKEKLYIDGTCEITGTLSVRDNNITKKFPTDIIPIGTIFPFYFKNASKFVLTRGYYNILTANNKPINNSLGLSTGVIIDDESQKCFINNVENNIYTIQIGQDYLVYNSEGELSLGNYDEKYSKFFINYDRNSENDYTIQGVHLNNTMYLNAQEQEPNVLLDASPMKLKLVPTIPPGWKPCTSTGGTITYTHNNKLTRVQVPNLENKFIMNYDTFNFPLGSEGGQESVTLTEANIPSHSHQMDYEGSHNHEYTGGQSEPQSHSHNIKLYDNIPSATQSSYGGLAQGYSGVNEATIAPFNLSETNEHSHSMTIEQSGTHTHSFNAFGSANNSAINVIPNCMDLIYIIKAI